MIRVNESVNFGLSSTSILIPCDNIIKKNIRVLIYAVCELFILLGQFRNNR